GLLGRGKKLSQLRAKGSGKERQTLSGQCFIGEEVFDHPGGKSRQSKFAPAYNAGAVDACEHPLIPQTLDCVGSALARVLGAGLDHVANLLEQVDEHVLLE